MAARWRVVNGRNEAFSAMTSMSMAAPVVSAKVTYIGPAFTAGSGLATKRTDETTMSSAMMNTAHTSSTRVPVPIVPGLALGGDVRPAPVRLGWRLSEVLRLILAPL